MSDDLRQATLKILESHESNAVRPRSPCRDVWLLDDPLFGSGGRKKVEDCRTEILRAVFMNPDSIFIHHESPLEYEVAGRWVEVAPSVWRLPDDLSLADPDLASWLRPGNWLLYSGDSPFTLTRSLFRLSTGEIAELVESRGLDLIIESFHDDNAWVVGLARAPAPRH